jgi:hypothetical protein
LEVPFAAAALRALRSKKLMFVAFVEFKQRRQEEEEEEVLEGGVRRRRKCDASSFLLAVVSRDVKSSCHINRT